MSLQGYYNRYDPADNYDELLFRASKGLQSAELNELQTIQSERLKRIADALFRDGAIVSDAPITIDTDTGLARLGAGQIYVAGAVRSVAAGQVTIPMIGTALIGVRLTTLSITELEDPELRDPAVGTRNFQEPGAGRTRRTIAWGWDGDGGTGTFYPIYTVINGNVLTPDPPQVLDPTLQLIARYDREANGNYIVKGLEVLASGYDEDDDAQVFNVRDGVGNVEGFKVDKTTGTRLVYVEDPDISQINNEPKNSASAGTQTLTLNYGPVQSILDVVITAEKTITVTRGPFSGGSDVLPDTSVLSIQSITQGGTTYVSGQDYNLVGDSVSWQPVGAEPGPGSTYSITYRYLTSVTPTNVNLQNRTFQISGAVANTLVLIDYRWKLPRYDVIALNKRGEIVRVRGLSARVGHDKPLVPNDLLALATINQKWGSMPEVDNDGTRVMDMKDLRSMQDAIAELYAGLAEERLRNDINASEPTTKFGIFVDPFVDDDMRDEGLEQNAIIQNGELTLPIDTESLEFSAPNTAPVLLPYTEVIILEQTAASGTMKINPYMVFSPRPILVRLNPAIDQWVVTEEINQDIWINTPRWWLWRRNQWWWWRWQFWGGRLWFNPNGTVTRTLIEQRRVPVQYLRQRTVQFTLSGMAPNEQLDFIRFAGINIQPN